MKWSLLEGTPFLSELQKRFYLTMQTERKEKILDFSLNALEQRNSQLTNAKQQNKNDREAISYYT